jgi:hypothetical protein
MVNPSSSGGGDWLNRQSSSPAEDPEITRLKERLGFYESFDQLIQDNVSRASELLKLAAGTRETAEQDMARARREMEELRAGDRQGYRAVLSGLLDDVTTMQVQIERLARRVSDALDNVESGLPAGGEFERLTASTSAAPSGIAAASDSAAFALDPTPDEIGPPEPFAESEATFRGIVPDTGGEEVEAEAAFAQAAEGPADLPYIAAGGTEELFAPSFAAAAAQTVPAVDAETAWSSYAASESDAAGAPVEPVAAQQEPDADLVVDEVVQAPKEASDMAPAGVPVEPAAGDGVLSDEPSTGAFEQAAPEAPAAPEPAPAVTPEEVMAEVAPAPVPAWEPGAVPAQAVAPAEEAAPEPAGTRLPWIAADTRPFSVEGTGSGVRPPGATEPSTPYSLPPTERPVYPEMPAQPQQAVPVAPAAPQPLAASAESAPPEPSAPLSPPEPASSSSPLPAAHGVATAVLVHGVPRATTALSLKRYLEGLAHVSGVEPREYAEGILRLHVIGERPVQIDDLRGWSDGSGLEPVHLRDDLVEVRLPH